MMCLVPATIFSSYFNWQAKRKSSARQLFFPFDFQLSCSCKDTTHSTVHSTFLQHILFNQIETFIFYLKKKNYSAEKCQYMEREIFGKQANQRKIQSGCLKEKHRHAKKLRLKLEMTMESLGNVAHRERRPWVWAREVAGLRLIPMTGTPDSGVKAVLIEEDWGWRCRQLFPPSW